MMSPTFKTLTQEGLTFRYLEGGNPAKNAPILLFVHGILGDARTFAPYLEAFADYRVLSLTLSGFGADSENETPLFDTARHGREIARFCQAIAAQSGETPPPITLFAWSYACHAALFAAQIEASNIRQLILYELIVPSYGITDEETKRFTRDITKMMSPIIKALRKEALPLAVDHFIAACENAPLTLAEQAPEIQTIKRDNFHTLPKLLSQVTPEPISAEDLLAIHQRCPITILWGENSRTIFTLSSFVASCAIGQNTREKADAPIGMIQGVTHLLPENDPTKMITEIKRIL